MGCSSSSANKNGEVLKPASTSVDTQNYSNAHPQPGKLRMESDSSKAHPQPEKIRSDSDLSRDIQILAEKVYAVQNFCSQSELAAKAFKPQHIKELYNSALTADALLLEIQGLLSNEELIASEEDFLSLSIPFITLRTIRNLELVVYKMLLQTCSTQTLEKSFQGQAEALEAIDRTGFLAFRKQASPDHELVNFYQKLLWYQIQCRSPSSIDFLSFLYGLSFTNAKEDQMPILFTNLQAVFAAKSYLDYSVRVKFLEDFRRVEKIQEEESYPDLKTAKEFLTKLLLHDKAKHSFQVYQIFGLPEDKMAEYKFDSKATITQQLQEELLSFLNHHPIYMQPNPRERGYIWATTYMNGIIALSNDLLVSKIFDKRNAAKIMITLIHELAHKKRMLTQHQNQPFKHTPQKIGDTDTYGEAGDYVETVLFGGKIDLNSINMRLSNELFEVSNWESIAKLKSLFGALNFERRKEETISPTKRISKFSRSNSEEFDEEELDRLSCGKLVGRWVIGTNLPRP